MYAKVTDMQQRVNITCCFYIIPKSPCKLWSKTRAHPRFCRAIYIVLLLPILLKIAQLMEFIMEISKVGPIINFIYKKNK